MFSRLFNSCHVFVRRSLVRWKRKDHNIRLNTTTSSCMTIGKGLLTTALLIGAINVCGFTITVSTLSHKITDLFGTGAFVVATLYNFFKTRKINNNNNNVRYNTDPRSTLLAIAISLWGVRLASYLFYRVNVLGEDRRFHEYFPKENEAWFDKEHSNFPIRLSIFWTVQSLWAWAVLLPSTISFYASASKRVQVGRLDLLAFALFVVGFALESVADYQKFVFRQDPLNDGKWLDTGLYRYSRFPNYFGEILVWASLYTLAAPSFTRPTHYASIISPLFVIFLLLFVTGIPILERLNENRFGSDPQYRIYKETTSTLVPWFPGSGSSWYSSSSSSSSSPSSSNRGEL